MRDQEMKLIESGVKAGNVVASMSDQGVKDSIFATMNMGISATFYVSRTQYLEIMRAYWTPRRIHEVGLQPIDSKELRRIKSELGVTVSAGWSNRLQCRCGAEYGGFEFMEQGIEEHGKDFVSGVFKHDVSVVRVNPSAWAVCRSCEAAIMGGHYYAMVRPDYGCCIPS